MPPTAAPKTVLGTTRLVEAPRELAVGGLPCESHTGTSPKSQFAVTQIGKFAHNWNCASVKLFAPGKLESEVRLRMCSADRPEINDVGSTPFAPTLLSRTSTMRRFIVTGGGVGKAFGTTGANDGTPVSPSTRLPTLFPTAPGSGSASHTTHWVGVHGWQASHAEPGWLHAVHSSQCSDSQMEFQITWSSESREKVGARDGVCVGLNDGVRVGENEGVDVVGACEGLCVGLREGDAVGVRDGEPVGVRDGELDGDVVGVREGDVVGVREGDAVGFCDGDCDGD